MSAVIKPDPPPAVPLATHRGGPERRRPRPRRFCGCLSCGAGHQTAEEEDEAAERD